MWGVARFRIPAEREEELSGWLAALGIGAEVASGPGDDVEVAVYVEDRSGAERLVAQVAAGLAAFGLSNDDYTASVDDVAGQPWVARYQASLRPFDLGRGFVVDPTGSRARDAEGKAGRIVLSLVPGQAFGTGEHPTTRLCAARLEEEVVEGSRWADLGCGSGILSLVAAFRGAREVLAVDCDEDAVRVARSVVAENGREGEVQVVEGDERALCGRFDGVVANISAEVLLGALPRIGQTLGPGAISILSGFLEVDVPELRREVQRVGLSVRRTVIDGEWAVIVAARES